MANSKVSNNVDVCVVGIRRAWFFSPTVLGGHGVMFEEPAMPWFHQPLSLGSGFFMEMEHAARTAAAWATLAVAIEQFLLIQEINGLVQNGFRNAQLWMLPLKSLEQSRGVAVVLQKTGEDPAHRKFEI
jgi:hypothetical protein